MQTVKTWALAKSWLDDSDIIWLKGLGVDLQSETLTDKVYLQGQVITEYVTGYRHEITTTCSKQETMLKLKYGDDLILTKEVNYSE
jgi:hypothetical protein